MNFYLFIFSLFIINFTFTTKAEMPHVVNVDKIDQLFLSKKCEHYQNSLLKIKLFQALGLKIVHQKIIENESHEEIELSYFNVHNEPRTLVIEWKNHSKYQWDLKIQKGLFKGATFNIRLSKSPLMSQTSDHKIANCLADYRFFWLGEEKKWNSFIIHMTLEKIIDRIINQLHKF